MRCIIKGNILHGITDVSVNNRFSISVSKVSVLVEGILSLMSLVIIRNHTEPRTSIAVAEGVQHYFGRRNKYFDCIKSNGVKMLATVILYYILPQHPFQDAKGNHFGVGQTCT